MPALDERQLVELTRRHHARVLAIRAATAGAVARLWDQLAPIGDAAAAEFVERAVPVVVGAQAAVSTSTSGYLRLATGTTGPAAVMAGGALRGGVSPTVVYLRGVITARKALAEGTSLGEALRIGRNRTLGTAATDVMLAQRAQIDAWAQAGQIVGYRRVLTGNSCLFCATASTQRYGSDHLAPLHAACDCGMAPIIGDRDPGQVINRPLLRDLKAKGPEYWRQRGMVDSDGNVIEDAAVHEHGELGPVLTKPGHKFTGPDDL